MTESTAAQEAKATPQHAGEDSGNGANISLDWSRLNPVQYIDRIAGITALALLVIGCLVILGPFLAAIAWAMVLVLATWPVFRWVEKLFKGRRNLAALSMTLLFAAALIVPLIVLAAGLADDVTNLSAVLTKYAQEGVPPPPHWVGEIPLVGGKLDVWWQELAEKNFQLLEHLQQYIKPTRDALLAVGVNIGSGLFDITISIFTAFFIFRDGEAAARGLDSVLERIAGSRAHRLLEVAERSITSVVYGILGTALAQGFLAAIGLAIAGVPGALALGVATAFLSIIPVGPPLIWIPAAGWLFYAGETGMGIFLVIWGAVVISTADNVLKPYFISRGTRMPLIIVLLGVLGGILAFGFLGIFLGPTLLAVAFTLLREWTGGFGGSYDCDENSDNSPAERRDDGDSQSPLPGEGGGSPEPSGSATPP